MTKKKFVRILALSLALVSLFVAAILPANALLINSTSHGYYCLEPEERTSITQSTGYSEANFAEVSTTSVVLKLETLVRADGFAINHAVFYVKSRKDDFNENSYITKLNVYAGGRQYTSENITMSQASGELTKKGLFSSPDTTIVTRNRVENTGDGWTRLFMAYWSPKSGTFTDAFVI